MSLVSPDTLMKKVLIKKAIGELHTPIEEIVETYGHKETVKTLLSIINGSEKRTLFYHKCMDALVKLEPTSKEDYPELWI